MNGHGRRIQLLFVCTANICRSPMAEAFMADHVAKAGLNVSVESAAVLDGVRRVHPSTRKVLADRAVAATKTHSTALASVHADRADLILTMTGQHAITVAGRHRHRMRRVFMLDHFATVVERPNPAESVDEWLDRMARTPRQYPNHPGALDIADPMGQNHRVFEAVADQLWALTQKVATALG